MGLLKASSGRVQRHPSATPLSTYQVGQRAVQLFQLSNGHIQWVCNCDDYAGSAGSMQGAWCKHVAKASAIRSIERLTGARVIGRSRPVPSQPITPAAESLLSDAVQSVQVATQPH
jgi:hypothetical protein